MVRRMRLWARFGLLTLLVLVLVLVSMPGCGSDTPADLGSNQSTDTTAEENGAPESLRLAEADSGGSFEIQAGGTMDIALEANPSTGYFWELADPDPEASLLEQVREPIFVSDDPNSVGSGGILTFTFRAVDKGEMIIKLVYLPPGGGDAPAKTFQIDITVR